MSKTEIVTELQTILNDLKGITADLEQNISGLKDFLEDRKFIPKELGASIREQLEAIDAKPKLYQSMKCWMCRNRKCSIQQLRKTYLKFRK